MSQISEEERRAGMKFLADHQPWVPVPEPGMPEPMVWAMEIVAEVVNRDAMQWRDEEVREYLAEVEQRRMVFEGGAR